MHFRTTFNAMETQQMIHFTVLSSYKIVLTAAQNTNVLLFSCKILQIFVRKLQNLLFIVRLSKKSSILNFNETHRFGAEFMYSERPTDLTEGNGRFSLNT